MASYKKQEKEKTSLVWSNLSSFRFFMHLFDVSHFHFGFFFIFSSRPAIVVYKTIITLLKFFIGLIQLINTRRSLAPLLSHNTVWLPKRLRCAGEALYTDRLLQTKAQD